MQVQKRAAPGALIPRFNLQKELRNVRRRVVDAPSSDAVAAPAAVEANENHDPADDAFDPLGRAARLLTRDVFTASAKSKGRGLDSGHEHVKKIRWALAKIAGTLERGTYTDKQAQFHDMMLYATLPILFGSDWDMHENTILAHYGLDTHYPRVIMSMPRSGGKTIAVTTFLAAFMWAMADKNLLLTCFAIQQAQTSWIVDKTYRFISVLPGGAAMCQRSSTAMMTSRKPKHMALATATILRAQSGNAAGSRGAQPDILILEEAAFIHDDLYYETVFPMLAKRGRAVFAISSPKEAQGLFAMMFRLRFPDTNDYVFLSVKDENICQDCLRAGRMDCTHIIPSLPPWKTEREKMLLKMCYAADKKRYAQEVEGAMGDSEVVVFQEFWVDRMFASQVRAGADVPFLFLAIDPAAGGKGSDTAWATLFFNSNDRIIVSGRARTRTRTCTRGHVYFGVSGFGVWPTGRATRRDSQYAHSCSPVVPSRFQRCSQSDGTSAAGVGVGGTPRVATGATNGSEPRTPTWNRGRGSRGGMRTVHRPRWSKCSRYRNRISSVKCSMSTYLRGKCPTRFPSRTTPSEAARSTEWRAHANTKNSLRHS